MFLFLWDVSAKEMEEKQYAEQKVGTWLAAAGFIKGVSVQPLLGATETLVWVLIGSQAVHVV